MDYGSDPYKEESSLRSVVNLLAAGSLKLISSPSQCFALIPSTQCSALQVGMCCSVKHPGEVD